MSINNGGSAFPSRYETPAGPGSYVFEGMSLRDYYAGQALIAMGMWCPNPNQMVTDPLIGHRDMQEARARYAFQQADAMIKARGE